MWKKASVFLVAALAIGWRFRWRILSFLIGSGVVLKIDPQDMSMKKRVCIIGAGPAGLSSAKQILELNDFVPLVFERNSEIGGQWLYFENPEADNHGLPVHSGIYKYMRANYPKQLLAFPDYQEFYGEERSYQTHDNVLQYLKNYTEHFNIRRFIQLDSLVEEVDFINDSWHLKVKDLNTYAHSNISCAAVVVCSGNYFKPYIPEIPGIENFPGRIIHSHNYRRPEEFANQTVAALGAFISGLEISGDLIPFARKIYLSNKNEWMNNTLPAKMEQIPGIVAADYTQLILSNGSRIEPDSLILCTGYLYHYPFLKPSTGITVEEGKYVYPLYKHLINIEHPTMAFITVPHPGLPWQLSYVQSHYFASVLDGKVKLPSREQMLEESALPPGTPKKLGHLMLEDALDYYKELAEAGNADPLPDFYLPAFWIWHEDIGGSIIDFKEHNLYIYDNGTIEFH